MHAEFYQSLFNFSASIHLLACALLLLVAIILLSPNTENIPGKRFSFFVLAIGLSQAAAYANKAHWVDFSIFMLSETVVMLAIAITLWRLVPGENKTSLKRWCAASFLIVLIGEAVWIIPFYMPALLAHSPFLTESPQLLLIGRLVAKLFVLLLSEQVFRNADRKSRILTRPFFLAVWIWMAADIYSTGYGILIGDKDDYLFLLSGYYVTFIAILLLIGSSRSTHDQTFSMSRDSAFYGTSLSLSSSALILMSLISYLISLTEASWVDSLQLIFIVVALALVTYLIVSSKARASIRVLINKNLFGSKYDYRNIWLTLINRLSSSDHTESFYQISLSSLVDILNADGGALWIERHAAEFSLAHCENLSLPESSHHIPSNAAFISPMLEKGWIYTLSGTNDSSAIEHNNLVPYWLSSIPNAWIVGPLIIAGEIVGFFLLTRGSTDESMIWEDLDVARSAGRQIASYISRQQSAEKIAESKQFDTYNQLTAFIMHDLKNLIAQQALVVKNADKHKDNPAFVEDMIRTVDNSVQRMNTLLLRLKRKGESSQMRSADLKRLLLDVIRKSTDRQPIPTLRNQNAKLAIKADIEQLTMVLTHLIRNAQDATANDGFIDIDIEHQSNEQVLVSIEDNGCGMSRDFIKNRLFKPFESTKSGMGMGIGAYQARDFIRGMGGDIIVESEENVGTTINILLPIS